MNLRQEQSLLYYLWELIHKQESVTIATRNFGPESWNATTLSEERQMIVEQIISLVDSFLTHPIKPIEVTEVKKISLKSYPCGMSVKELKELIKDWPDEYESGEPTAVWIGTGQNRSSVVTVVWPLNKIDDCAEILLSSI